MCETFTPLYMLSVDMWTGGIWIDKSIDIIIRIHHVTQLYVLMTNHGKSRSMTQFQWFNFQDFILIILSGVIIEYNLVVSQVVSFLYFVTCITNLLCKSLNIIKYIMDCNPLTATIYPHFIYPPRYLWGDKCLTLQWELFATGFTVHYIAFNIYQGYFFKRTKYMATPCTLYWMCHWHIQYNVLQGVAIYLVRLEK